MNHKNKTLFQKLMEQGHKAPTSRRDFMAMGLASSAGFVAAPSLLQMIFSNVAKASDIESGNLKGSNLPFIVIDCVGGAALSGNFLVGGPKGPEDLLFSYKSLGWNPKGQNAFDKRFGLPMAGNNVSRIFTGITQSASNDAQKNFRMGSFLHRGQDDNNVNQHSAFSLVGKAGLGGLILDNGLGMRTTPNGGFNRSPIEHINSSAIEVTSPGTMSGILKGEGRFERLDRATRRDFFQSLFKSYEGELKEFAKIKNFSRLQDVVLAGAKKQVTLSMMDNPVDPRMDPLFKKLFNVLDEPESVSGERERQTALFNANSAAVVMNVLKRNVGGGTIAIGGCDYHDQSQTTGDAVDQIIGQTIGRIVEAAHQLKTPVMIQVITDGGVYSRDDSRVWQGDDGAKCMTVLGMYNPVGAPKMRDQIQIGHYVSTEQGTGYERETIVGRGGVNADIVAYAVLANYLNVTQQSGRFTDLIPSSKLNTREIDQVLIFD